MGYSYGYNENGRMVLSCDQCGNVGGVRKRACTYKVTGSSLRSTSGHRPVMHYCSPPALCGPCLKALGGNRKLHAGCAAGAAASQIEYHAEQAIIDSGQPIRTSAFGAWHDAVPTGQVLVLFHDNRGVETAAFVSDAEYHALGCGTTRTLADYTTAQVTEVRP